MVRIVSWNLNRKPSTFVRLHELDADVALVQEAVIPPGMIAVNRPGGIAGRDGKARPWGSAVIAVAQDVALTPIGLAEGVWHGRGLGLAPIDAVSRGHVAIAVAELSGTNVTLISAYGLMEFGYASGTLLRTMADLEPLLDSELGRNVILAGDWNIGTWWSGGDQFYARRERAVLDLLEAYGLQDCLSAHLAHDRGRLAGCRCDLDDACRHIWTYRKDGSDVPYMDDYFFATKELAARFSSVQVEDQGTWESSLSDHAPIIADLP